MLYPHIVYKWQMLLPSNIVEDVIPHNCMLQHILFKADVIAKWQMEHPLQGGCLISTGRCYYQAPDEIATGSELF